MDIDDAESARSKQTRFQVESACLAHRPTTSQCQGVGALMPRHHLNNRRQPSTRASLYYHRITLSIRSISPIYLLNDLPAIMVREDLVNGAVRVLHSPGVVKCADDNHRSPV